MGERPEAALVREMKEELGIDVRVAQTACAGFDSQDVHHHIINPVVMLAHTKRDLCLAGGRG